MIATFDAPEGATYNRENCEIARVLFQEQPGVNELAMAGSRIVRYFCHEVPHSPRGLRLRFRIGSDTLTIAP